VAFFVYRSVSRSRVMSFSRVLKPRGASRTWNFVLAVSRRCKIYFLIPSRGTGERRRSIDHALHRQVVAIERTISRRISSKANGSLLYGTVLEKRKRNGETKVFAFSLSLSLSLSLSQCAHARVGQNAMHSKTSISLLSLAHSR